MSKFLITIPDDKLQELKEFMIQNDLIGEKDSTLYAIIDLFYVEVGRCFLDLRNDIVVEEQI